MSEPQATNKPKAEDTPKAEDKPKDPKGESFYVKFFRILFSCIMKPNDKATIEKLEDVLEIPPEEKDALNTVLKTVEDEVC